MSDILITVIMPVRNGMPYLKESIESLLNQTEKSFNLYIIDDHSDDCSIEYIKSLSDERIHLFPNTGNGLIDALNLGLSKCNTEFVARMDADDISDKNRFREQLNYLQKNKRAVLVGTWYEYFSYVSNKKVIRNKLPVVHNDIFQKMSRVENAMCHSSIMVRQKLFDEIGFYDKASYPAEDYNLFFRALEIGELHNIPKFLHKVRISESSVFSQSARESMAKYCSIRNNFSINSKVKSNPIVLLPYSIAFYRKGLFNYLNNRWLRTIFYITISLILAPRRGLNFFLRNFYTKRNQQ